MADRAVTIIPARKTFARASETNVLRVAAYTRVSTDSDEQMGSVAAQKDYFEKLIQKNPAWVLVAILGKQNPRFFREVMQKNLENAGHTADIVDMATRTFLDFASELKDYDAIITCGEKLPGPAVQELGTGKVKLISRWGVGTDEIDKVEAARQGIAVCNAANSLSVAVAECAIGMMINLLREFPARDASVRENDWSWFFEGLMSHQLEGKTVGLIGFGNIAKALAKMLGGFDCRIIACDDYYWDAEAAERMQVEKVPMEEIIRTADVISLHLAATEDTFDMVNRDFLQKMKNSAILINTARGALVDEDALVWALDTQTPSTSQIPRLTL